MKKRLGCETSGRAWCRCGLVLAVALARANAAAAVSLVINPSTISNTYSGIVGVDISGLANGESVVFQHYLDLNDNGALDASDWLLQHVRLTDGFVPTIAGVTNYAAPYDRTGTNGAISTGLNYTASDDLNHVVGRHLFRVAGASGAATNSLRVTNQFFGQAIRGLVQASSTNVPNAVVVLLDMNLDGVLAAATIASSSGGYTNRLPPGFYLPMALRPGYVAEFSAAGAVWLTNGATVTTNLNLIPTDRLLLGRLVDAANTNLGLPGVLLFAESETGHFTVATTETNGAFSIRVTAGHWRISIEERALSPLGYVGPDDDELPTFDTSAGNVSNVVLTVSKADALFYGTVRTVAGTPLGGVDIDADDQDDQYDLNVLSGTNGMFALPVVGGRWWWIGGFAQWNAAVDGYVLLASRDAFIGANQAVRIDLVAAPATGTIRGWVRDSSTNPIPYLRVYAWAEIGTNSFDVYTETDAEGYYTLLVADGTWHVGCWDLNERGYEGVPEQQCTVPPTNVTLNFTVRPLAPLQITTESLPFATVGQWYEADLTASGGLWPYRWSLAPGSSPLPPGLTLYDDGSIAGVPAADGLFEFTVCVTDYRNSSTNRTLSIMVMQGVGPLEITTTALPPGTVGQYYTAQLQARGGQPPYWWGLPPGSGPLPPGLNLFNDGAIRGVPLSNGTFSVTVEVRDGLGSVASRTFSITIALPPPTPPVLEPPQRAAEGRFQFSLGTVPGGTYTVLYSTTLTNWMELLRFQGAGGRVTIVDWGPGDPKRFYWVRLGP